MHQRVPPRQTDADMEAAVSKETCPVVCMDERGQQRDSPAFSAHMHALLEQGGSRLAFVVGGAEGLPQSLKQEPRYDKMSLSKVRRI
jgi:23S rRNA (pseudouridine1915-N3)-methyltransferase